MHWQQREALDRIIAENIQNDKRQRMKRNRPPPKTMYADSNLTVIREADELRPERKFIPRRIKDTVYTMQEHGFKGWDPSDPLLEDILKMRPQQVYTEEQVDEMHRQAEEAGFPRIPGALIRGERVYKTPLKALTEDEYYEKQRRDDLMDQRIKKGQAQAYKEEMRRLEDQQFLQRAQARKEKALKKAERESKNLQSGVSYSKSRKPFGNLRDRSDL